MKTYLLTEPDFYGRLLNDVGRVPGIYRLHCLSEAGRFEHIQRLLGVDEEGILYIGTAKDLITRIMSLMKSVSAAYGENSYRDPRPHPCGVKIALSSKFRDRLPFDRLCLSLEQCEPDAVNLQVGTHTKLEWEKLSQYSQSFGEFPPLNG